MRLKKVISGGQTGVDQIGLFAAKEAGLETGGTAPKGFRTENGPKPQLGTLFGLKEHWDWRYDPRTEDNVADSDATLLFGDMDSTGSRLTIKLLKKHKKPYKINPSYEEILSFLSAHYVIILNIAGNRGSKLTKEYRQELGKKLLKAFTYLLKSNNSDSAIVRHKSE